MVDLTDFNLWYYSVRSSNYRMGDVSEVWSSCGKLGHILWKLFSKRACQENSDHDDVNHDFDDRLTPSQFSQEDSHLPENAGTKHRSCNFVAAPLVAAQFRGCTVAAAQVQRSCLRQDSDGGEGSRGPDMIGLTVHRIDKTGKYLAAHQQILGCTLPENTRLHTALSWLRF